MKYYRDDSTKISYLKKQQQSPTTSSNCFLQQLLGIEIALTETKQQQQQ